ncbi:MAG: nucleotidyltransferase domain-containing protein [Spirochaetes bacterium]|nr:nucleotidyltransferase domain-containing protein [Spirochaetota bacterium]
MAQNTREDIIIKLKKIKPELQKQYGVKRIGIFGSIARNEANDSSDIDIVYEVENINGFSIVHIKEDLEHYFNKTVDIVRYRQNMNPYLKDRINSEGIYV